jgi:SAM-dependent methyltransferase
MKLSRARRHWEALGKTDPLWAILSEDAVRDNRWEIDEFFATGESEIAELMSYVATLDVELDRRSALDFGCGVGRLTRALAERFGEVWGIDIAPSMIELARRYDRHPDRCHFAVNMRSDLQMFGNDRFGFVYSSIVLQHIEPRYQERYLSEFIRVLAPGGLLVFQLPSEPIVPTGGGAKGVMRSAAPPALLAGYRKVRQELTQMGKGPRMEMWGTPRAKVERLLQGLGATIVEVKPDSRASGWTGFLYTVAK